MHIVATHVPDAHRLAFAVFGFDVACVGKAGCLFDWKRVHVGAKHYSRTLAITEQTDDARPSNLRRHFVGGCAKPIRGQSRRPRLLHRQLWMRVHVLVQGFELRNERIYVFQNGISGCRSGRFHSCHPSGERENGMQRREDFGMRPLASDKPT